MEAALCNINQVQGKVGLVRVCDLIKRNTFVGLYFSSRWCPPCRGFNPKLVEFYNTMKANGHPLEIIFVSFDRDQANFDDFYSKMPWHAIPYSDGDKRDELADKHGVKGIPYLVIMDSQGTIIDKEARGTVQTACGTDIPAKWRKE